MLSNVQEAPLDTLSRIMPVSEARALYDSLARDPDRGRNTLAGLGASAGLLMWAPFEHDHLHRLMSMYEVVLTQMPDPPTLALLVPHDPYPGVTIVDLLYDLWRRPLQQRNRAHMIQDVRMLPVPVRCTLTGTLGPRQVDKAIVMFTLAGKSQPPMPMPWPSPTVVIPTGPGILLDGPTGRSLGRPSSHLPSIAPWPSSL